MNFTKESFCDFLIETANNGGFPSTLSTESNNCRYRGMDGKKCPIGHLIPDDKYSDYIEGKLVLNKDVQELINVPEGMGLIDLANLQQFHDQSFEDGIWKKDEFVNSVGWLKNSYTTQLTLESSNESETK